MDIIKKVYRRIWFMLFRLFRFLPIWNDVVLFESFIGKNVNDSPKAIFDYMKKTGTNRKLVWVVDAPEKYEIDGAIVIRRLSPKYYIYIARAKYIVNNSRMPNFFVKRKEQVYVQTWHGTPLKKLVFDMETNVMPGTNKESYLKNFKNEVDNWDYLVSPNSYSTEKFKRAFKFEKEFLEVGYPRNEYLHTYTEEDRTNLRSKFGLGVDDIAILYTPTYRDSKNNGRASYYQELELDLEKLDATTNVKVFLRVHYLISEAIDVSKYKNIIDVSSYPSINDLFIASDALLNDYSSTMFDYLALDKPLILFPYDLSEYKNDIRGFYMEYSQLPGEVIDGTDRLIEIANNLRSYHAIWKEDLSEFKQQMVLDSEKEASKLIVKKMFNK